MMDSGLIAQWSKWIIPVILGGAGGFLYYRFVGCRTGMCPLTSNPWISTLYGALIGALIAGQ
jgi:hypothetical protein